MSRIVVAAGLLALVSSTQLRADSPWTSYGPDAAHVTVFASGPASPWLYAATAARRGSIFRKLSDARAWESAGIPLVSMLTTSLVVDPFDERHLYVGLSESRDAGETWTALRGFIGGDTVYPDPAVPGTLYAPTHCRSVDQTIAFDCGILVSRDGGKVWTRRHKEDQVRYTMVGNRTGVFGWSGRTLLRSRDQGRNWSRHSLPFFVSAMVASADSFFALASDGRIFKASDPTRAWSGYAAPPSIPTQLTVSSSGAVGVASGSSIHVSRDGVTWQTLDRGLESLVASNLTSPAFSTIYFHGEELYAALTDQARAAAQSSGVYRFDADQAAWRGAAGGITNSLVSTVFSAPSRAGRIYASGADGLFRSDDGGLSWRTLSASRQLLAVDPTNADRVYARRTEGVERSDDAGVTFMPLGQGIVPGEVIETLAIHPTQPATMLAGGKRLYLTMNAGAAWLPVGAENVRRVVFAPSAPSTAYAISTTAGILKSVDGGTTWVPMNGDLQGSFTYATDIAVDTKAPNLVYATRGNLMFISRDGAQSWALAQFSSAIQTVQVLRVVTSEGRVFISIVRIPVPLGSASATRFILMSSDGAATWREVSSALPSSTLGVAVDGHVVYAAIAGSGVYRAALSQGRRRSVRR